MNSGSKDDNADVSDAPAGIVSPEEGSLADRLMGFTDRGSSVRRRKRPGRPLRVLHVLSQQPGKTGSGIYLQSMVRHAAEAGFRQRVIIGMPADAPMPEITPLSSSEISAVYFGTDSLPFAVAGMSDVMPYKSTRFSDFDATMLSQYLDAFASVISREVKRLRPHVIHTHHLWLVTALTRLLCPSVPVVTTCHGTELRQLDLAPGLARFVVPPCRAVDRVMALHELQREAISTRYGIDPERVLTVGAGYREDIFCVPDQTPRDGGRDVTIVYAGKLSRAKGLPWLIEAVNRIETSGGMSIRLLIAGSGEGQEADEIRGLADSRPGRVRLLGPLPQAELAAVLREADIFALPSFYEGLPLVVLEALACCCRVIVTDLPGSETWLPTGLVEKGIVEKVPLPPLIGPDVPDPEGLEAFVSDLTTAIRRQMSRCACGQPNWYEEAASCIAPMRWAGVFEKVRDVYLDVLS